MQSAILKKMSLGMAFLGLGVSVFFFVRCAQLVRATPDTSRLSDSSPNETNAEDHRGTSHYQDVLVSVDELLVNIESRDKSLNHSVTLKLELELFDESDKALLEQKIPGIIDRVLQVTREQEFERLNTISGKLYLKELLVSGLNGYLREPLIRDVHFSSFYLR